MVFGSILKKKIREEQIANIFTNSIVKSVDQGFADVASIINDAPEFIIHPGLSVKNSSNFMLIVIAGNLKMLSNHFNSHQEHRLTGHIIENFANIFELPKNDFNELVNDYSDFISKVNHPSKNVLYGMSKAVFYKYNLSNYQEHYFRKLNAPNPLFLKRLDEVLESFIWDWNHLKKNYNLVIK